VPTNRERIALRSWSAFAALCLVLILCPGQSLRSAAQQSSPANLADRSLEDLMKVEVTSASKKQQRLSQIEAAVFVITQEDIRHSGARNIPDFLRIVPGLDVAQINDNTWAISSRGFNSQFRNKLLLVLRRSRQLE
jgi:iron complex outermembrane receptor protein